MWSTRKNLKKFSHSNSTIKAKLGINDLIVDLTAMVDFTILLLYEQYANLYHFCRVIRFWWFIFWVALIDMGIMKIKSKLMIRLEVNKNK